MLAWLLERNFAKAERQMGVSLDYVRYIARVSRRSHDLGETAQFDRILVIADGRIVESGTPGELAARPGSRYRSLLDAEERLRKRLWADRAWRTVRIENGRLMPVADAELRAGSAAASAAHQRDERGNE